MRGWRLLLLLLLPVPMALAAFYAWRPGGTAVFLITLDTVRADRLGCYGYETAQTPFIDGLATRGTLFEHAVTAAPFTPSSHASIFTGLCPCEHGVRFAWRFRKQQMKPEVRTLAELFKAGGFATAAFISARPMQKSIHSLDRGFDIYDESFLEDNTRTGALEHQRRADQTLAACSRWLESVKPEKFFAFIHLFDVHDGEVDPPAEFRKQYLARLDSTPGDAKKSRRASARGFDRYDYEITYMDSELGKFFDKVRSLIGRSKLQVILLSDHGEGLGDHDYNRHAERVYQAQLRVPMIWSGDGIPKRQRADSFIRTIDILPTLAEMHALNVPAGVQGASLVPVWRGRDTSDRLCYSETRHPMINKGEALFSMIKDRRKLIYAPESQRFEYYNLAEDPRELRDLAAAGGYDDLLAELKKHDLSIAPPREDLEEVEDLQVEEGLRALGYVN